MFEFVTNKIIMGVVSAGMLLFSSYEGNEVKFSSPQLIVNENSYYLSTNLESAFDNSFEEILKSGEEIFIDFELKMEKNPWDFKTITFYHSTQYNSMNKSYTVRLDEQQQFQQVNDFANLVSLLSHVNMQWEEYELEVSKLTLSASIRNVRLPSLDKQYNMMMLWNFKQPTLKIDLRDYQNEN
ncbi:MAG: DUF4390 domain-containing protein [Candidatus Cloacimonadales bacterium]